MLRKLAIFGSILVLLFLVTPINKVSANHSWGNYHWERSSNPVALNIGYNLTSEWLPMFYTAVGEWDQSLVLELTAVQGSTDTRRCKAGTGKIEVCNDSYGLNGWLGVAGISVSGSHITSAYVKLNDSYYAYPTYNTTEWRRLVMCQEIGHAFGLDHQDENFNNANLRTCMDYTNDPSTNQSPNQHDYEQLATIYEHTDGGGTGDPTPCRGRGCNNNGADVDFGDPREWGRVVETDDQGRPILYMRDLGNGMKHFTHIFPVPDDHRGRGH